MDHDNSFIARQTGTTEIWSKFVCIFVVIGQCVLYIVINHIEFLFPFPLLNENKLSGFSWENDDFG